MPSLFINILYRIPFWFLLVFCTSVQSQNDNLKFTHLTSDDGLSQNFISVILQDKKGFMWFGTKDGLNRYDGYDFKIYRHNPFDSSSLTGSHITALFEDSKERLWVGSSGLSLLNPHNDTFRRIKLSADQDDEFLEVLSITEDKTGFLWIGTNNGLFRYNPVNDLIKKFTNRRGDPSSVSSNSIRSLSCDDSLLFVGTSRGINYLNLDSLTKGKVKFQTLDEQNRNTNIICQYRSSSNILYLGTPDGLLKVDVAEKKSELIRYAPNVFKESWLGRILSITKDKNGRLWIGCSGALMIYNPGNDKFIPVYHNPMDENSLSFNGIMWIFTDRSGKIWIGTAGKGINIFDQNRKEFTLYKGFADKEPYRTGFSVSALLCDSNNDLWSVINTDLYRINRTSGEYTRINLSAGEKILIFSIKEDIDKNIWIGTNDGLYKIRNGQVKHYVSDPSNNSSIRQNNVYALLIDKAGALWVLSSGYLSKYSNSSDSFRHYELAQGKTLFKYLQTIKCIYQGYNGEIWIGGSGGLFRYDISSGNHKFYHNIPGEKNSLSHNEVSSVCSDPVLPQKYLWIGTMGGGLIRFNLEDESFTGFSMNEGLPNNVIYGILSTGSDIWLSSNYGLSRLTTDKYGKPAFRNYDVTDGLQGNEFNAGAYCKNNYGELFFGGLNGINAFYPSKIRDNLYIPPVVITELRFLQRTGVNDNDNGKRLLIGSSASVIIPFSDNMFNIGFASLDYTAPHKNKYMYKLLPLNENWIYLDEQRNVTFNGLEPGEYQFVVKGSNNDGVWNETGAVLNIIIDPPFWRTTWAYSSYLVLFILLLYAIRKYELNRIALKNNLKREFFEKQKLQELDEIRSGFFSNISHEFRTPLTLILGPVEQLEQTVQTKYISDKLNIIKENANRLLRLINQILDISKLEEKLLKPVYTKGDIIQFIKGIAVSFHPSAEVKNKRLSFTTDLPCLPMMFDRDIIEKIILNLISNALKFTKENGSIILSIGADKGFCKISVKDDGMGIPESELNNVFSKFYQVKDSSNGIGTGIGLALVKELTEAHGGTITVESKLNEGSTFTVSIPIIPTSDEENLIIAEEVKSEVSDFASPAVSENLNSSGEVSDTEENDLIVLVIEDDPDVRMFICEQLNGIYQVISADNGAEGLEKAYNVIPDLIISDIMMPVMNGYELCRKIKNDVRTSHIPIVLLTAKADEKDKLTGLETGADDYLTKPFSSKELLVRIKNLIEIRQKLRRLFSNAITIKPKEIVTGSIDKNFIERALKIVEDNIRNTNFTVMEFSSAMNLSHSQLHRKLKALLNQSANQFIRSIRMQRAIELLKSNAGGIAEIAYMVGFTDPGYFTKAFSKHFGYVPSEIEKEKS